MARFDLGAAAPFQSRDGGLTRGGQVRNGFLEKEADGVWSWMRPALTEGVAAPFSGTGLALIPLGTTLYGIWSNGTATSQAIPRVTNFVLGAALLGTSPISYGFLFMGAGSISPSTWRGASVAFLNAASGTTGLGMFGTIAQNFITAIRFGGSLLPTAGAAYSISTAGGGVSQWLWSTNVIPAVGTYTGQFY